MHRANVGVALALVAALMGCGDGDLRPLEIELVLATSPDPLDRVVRMRLVINGGDIAPLQVEADRSTAELRVPSVPTGPDRQVVVEGLDGGGTVVSRGRSVRFELTDDSPERVRVVLFRLDTFSRLPQGLQLGRKRHTAALAADGRVFVTGGLDDGNKPLNTVEVFDPASGAFSPGTPLSRARGEHQGAIVDGLIVLVGGRDDDAATTAEVYAVDGGPQGEIALREHRRDHRVAALQDGRVLVVGGRNKEGAEINKVSLIDPVARTIAEAADLEPPRSHHAMVTLQDGRVLVAGGERAGAPLGDAWIYQPSSNSWSTAPSMPHARSRMTATLLADGRVLLAGGSGPESHEDWLIFESGSWRRFEAEERELSRLDHAADRIGNGAIIAGGGPASVDLYDGGQLLSVGTLVTPRKHLTLTALLDGSVLAVGGENAGRALTDAEIFIAR